MNHHAFISSLDGDLDPLQQVAIRLSGSDTRSTGDAVEICNRPAIGPSAYAITLFLPLSEATTLRYEQVHQFSISPRYRPILQKLNGAHLFGMGLFGIPPSMANDVPKLDRSGSAPFDVATANLYWKNGYPVPPDWFHFGSSDFSYTERVGYFFDSDGTIVSMLKSGERIGKWATFPTFLAEEISRCEAQYPDSEARFVEALRSANRPWWRLYRWLRGT